MTYDLSPAAMDRPKQTIHAAEIFHDNARNIASVCSDIPADHVALAVVDRVKLQQDRDVRAPRAVGVTARPRL